MATDMRIVADEYFDGTQRVRGGPFAIEIRSGKINAIAPLAEPPRADDRVCAFAMPGLVEAHAHIFLDGAELDAEKRSAYFKADIPEMLNVARANVAKNTRAGVTLVRDAGDKYGVNVAIRQELQSSPDALLRLRAPGLGIKRPKRYGGFMARDVSERGEIEPMVEEMARDGDDIKIILTGIIDFATGTVKGDPQFDREELADIVRAAHRSGRKTFAHCSGLAGLEVAADVGVDSIEHGFFMTNDILAKMADKGIAWVPTFSPVHFQWARPEIVGWDDAAIEHMRRILADHHEHVGRAHGMGVNLVAGSDAGSQGVDHGGALIDELFHFLQAGLPMDAVLASATSRPRALWGVDGGALKVGAPGEIIGFQRSPYADQTALRSPYFVVFKDNFTPLRPH